MVSHLQRGVEVKKFENKVPRMIFGTKRDEITGEWRKLHNAELNSLKCSTNIISKLAALAQMVA